VGRWNSQNIAVKIDSHGYGGSSTAVASTACAAARRSRQKSKASRRTSSCSIGVWGWHSGDDRVFEGPILLGAFERLDNSLGGESVPEGVPP